MKPALALAALAILAPTAASADVIKCSFTEPFIGMTYSMTQSTLEITTPDGPTTTFDDISFQILGPAEFELWNADNEPVLSLTLDNEGSDGMSETVYPYTANKGAQGGMSGGCWSNQLHRIGGE